MADRSLIAHLFRRAGFGARPEEIDYYAVRDYTVAVDDLVEARSIAGQMESLDETLSPALDLAVYATGRVIPQLFSLTTIQESWLRRMVTTTRPLVERMTLMLHDHFATAYSPGDFIDTPQLTAQNELFRSHALGNWADLCHALLEDVALGQWLDADQNLKDAPNENLARELMELFVLGVDGGYNEWTVREAARSLTGYHLDNFNPDPLGPPSRMVFQPENHDDGEKVLFGVRGNFMPHDVVNILLAQPAASRWLARRLIATFVTPTPTNGYVEAIASILRVNNWELKPALRAIFLSSEFASARGTIVKTPAEFIAGAWRAVGAGDYAAGNRWMGAAGQRLYDPPNVGGWVPNDGWLSAGLLLARYNAAVALSTLSANTLRLKPLRGATSDEWALVFGMTELAPSTRAGLDHYLKASSDMSYSPEATDLGIITLVVSSPDFSLA